MVQQNEVKHLDIKHIYSASLFAKHLIAAEYHEQKSAGYIKTGLRAVCVQNRATLLDESVFLNESLE